MARQVETGEADYGVMAVENSIAGTILPNLGILHNARVQIVGEYYLHIRQNLMVLPGVELGDIVEVQSHPMALLQCVDFLDAHRWKLVETEDTALSAIPQYLQNFELSGKSFPHLGQNIKTPHSYL